MGFLWVQVLRFQEEVSAFFFVVGLRVVGGPVHGGSSVSGGRGCFLVVGLRVVGHGHGSVNRLS